jgi:DNA-binding CsgD family transcriptional regulator
MGARDIIGVVEAAYRLDGTETEWLQEIANAAYPVMPPNTGLVAFTHQVTATGPSIGTMLTVGAPPGTVDMVLQVIARASEAELDATVRAEPHCNTLTGLFGSFERLQDLGAPFGVKDVLGVTAMDPDGHGCTLTAGLGQPTLLAPAAKWNWTRVAAHLAAAHRLRRHFASAELDTADAVLEVAGKVAHAAPAASSSRAQAALRRAARAIDRARTEGVRRDEDEALGLWTALVAGEWSLVDRFDTDGRHYLVARQNAPELRDPRALSRRERQVAGLIGMGHSGKTVAYELGLSAPAVSRHLRSALRKLGLSSPAALWRLAQASAVARPEP